MNQSFPNKAWLKTLTVSKCQKIKECLKLRTDITHNSKKIENCF